MSQETLSLYQFFQRFPNEDSARKYFEEKRWKGHVTCPHCGSDDVLECKNHNPMPYRCRTCRKYFSVRIGTVLEESKLPLHKWLMCMYLLSTARKGISSIQIAKELGITQKSAWFLSHRIREVWMRMKKEKLEGIVEVDETFIGGKESNKHHSKKLNQGRGSVGKLVVIGAKQRDGRVIVNHINDTSSFNLQGFIEKNVQKSSDVFTDEFRSYKGLLGFNHEVVNHSRKEYVKGRVHTNSIESFWSILKRGYYGIYHYMSPKHLKRYIHEFAFRYNSLKGGVLNFIDETIGMMIGMKLEYCELIRK